MKKIKIFKSGFCEKLKLLLIPIGLLIGSFTMHAWAGSGFNDKGQWQICYNDGSDHYTGYKDNGAEVTLGVKTYLKLISSDVKTWGDVKTNLDWWISYWSSLTARDDGAGNFWSIYVDWNGDHNNYLDCNDYDMIANARHPVGNDTLFMAWSLRNYYTWTATAKVIFTIPGFKDVPASKNFGTAPKGSESETTISFTHYGDVPTLSNCTITGTNASDFEVRAINNSGVTVVFKPTTVSGTRNATLTINDGLGMTCSSKSISLTGTAGTSGTVTRLYFNDYQYSGAGNWAAASAKYRFTCTYTSGVVTRYNMTKCDNTEHTYYADVDVRSGYNVSIDRYNPSSPYVTWNTATPTSPILSSSNPYAKSTNINGAYATNHPYNDVTGGMVYYDNSKSGITNTLYLVVGHDHNVANNNSDTYSSGYAMTNITNTKMYYHTFSATTWHDADYYGVIGATSDPTGDYNWGSSSLASKGSTRGYTAAYKDLFGLLSGSTYLATAPSKTGGTLSFSQNPTLNTTQTFNYALSTDGGSTYPALTSGVNTPGQLKLESYYFTSATAVSKNADQTLSANATTYTKSKNNVAYTGTTVLTESNTREGYTFMGWYKGNSTPRTNSSTHSFTYYPQGDSTYTARYKAHRYTINFSANDAQYPGTTSSGSMTSISNVVYDQNVTLTENDFEREGYTFAGWNREADGSGASYTDEQRVINLTATDGATVTLYAQWNEILHDITVEYKYGETSVQVDGKVEDVGIVTTKDATAPATIGGYSFTEWSTLPSAVKTSDELTENTITINATDDGQTITANYEPTTYNGTLEGVDGSDGTYSVVYGETTLTVTGEAPARAGYHPQGYYLYYDGTLKNYSNPIAYASETTSKELVKSAPGGLKTHTDADGKWIYTGDAPTIYIQWEANTHTLTLYKNDGTGDNIPTSVTYGSNVCTPTITIPTRAGYDFAGYWTAASEGSEIIRSDLSKIESSYFDASTSNWKYDGDVDLYAHWTPVALSFTNGGGDGSWTNTANWSPACVPTSGHDVTINAETEISGSAVANSVTIGSSGKVTIQPTGVLEVAGTVTNTDADKLIINTDDSNQGALICDNSAGSTQATVNLTTQYANGKFQFIAIPLSGVSVASTFSGKGKYTYGWKYGEGWERRGYYDAFTAFEAVLLMGQTYTSFAGALVSTNDFSASLSYDESKVFGGVYMYGNSWTAPIRRSDMTLSGILSINILNGSSNGWDGVVSDDVIPALQGYAAVVGSSGGSISIDYDDAVRNAATPNASLRAPKRNVSDPIAVYVTSNEMQTRIRLFEDEQFTDELDEGYEALYMEGNGYAGELYAMGAKKMNVLATSDLEGTVVGFVPGQATEYTISFAGEGKGYYLNDIEAQESTLISEENTYTFLSGTNDAARFIVSRTPISKTTTGNEAIYDGVKARKQMINGVLYIIKDGRMYNAEGMIVK